MWGAISVVSFLLDEGGFMHGELIMLSEETPENPFEPEAPEEETVEPIPEDEEETAE